MGDGCGSGDGGVSLGVEIMVFVDWCTGTIYLVVVMSVVRYNNNGVRGWV